MNHKLAVALLLLPLCLPAQEPETTAANSPKAAPESVVVSLKFSGGTMADFVAAVRDDQPKANIVLATKAQDARVPAMVLRNAGLEQALEGAAMAAEAAYDVRVKEFRGAGEPVYSIVAYARQGAATVNSGMDPNAPMQRVFSLNDLTAKPMYGAEPISVRTILSAIDLAMAGESPEPQIRFHEDSGLLLTRGTYGQLRTIEEALRTLQEDLTRRDQRAQIREGLEMQRRAMEQAQPGGGGTGNPK